MKNCITNIFKFIGCIAIAVLFNACSEEFLEIEPKGIGTLTRTEDFRLFLKNSSLSTQDNAIPGSLIYKGPEACAIEPIFSTFIVSSELRYKFFAFEPDFGAGGTGHAFDRINPFTLLYGLNAIVNGVMDSKGGTEAQKREIWAQAKVFRAYINYKLLKVLGQTYDPATANTDLGIIDIQDFDVTVTDRARMTLQESYDFIINDIKEALPYLPANINRDNMSKPVGHMLLGLQYLQMHNYQDALTQFDGAFTAISASNGLSTALFDYNVSTLPGGAHAAGRFFPAQPRFGDDTEMLFGEFNSIIGAKGIRPWIFMSPETSALYGPNDLRLSALYSHFPFRSSTPYSVPGVYRRLYNFEFEGLKLNNLYLLRAECRARTGNTAGAIADLQFLRNHRIKPTDAAVPSGLSQDALIKYIVDERIREFAMVNGEPFMDVKRLWNDPLFQDRKPYQHKIYNADGSVKETFTLTKNRLVLQIPGSIMDQNPSLINNPD